MKEIKLTPKEKKKHTSIPEAIKEVKAKKSTVKLVSYTIRATIATGPYSNICPEITVKAETIGDAANYIMGHIDSLFALYLNRSERRTVEPKVEVKETPAPKNQ